MIRTGQINRHSKWYVFVNEVPDMAYPHDTEVQAEEDAKGTYGCEHVVTTDDKDHPIHTNPWTPSGSPNYQQVKKGSDKAKTISKKLLTEEVD